MAIELDECSATITSLKTRAKSIKGDPVLVCVMTIEMMLPAGDVLPYFDPALRGMLFDGDKVRFPRMLPIKWQATMQRMEIEASGIPISDAKLTKFVIEPMQDGQAEGDMAQLVFIKFQAEFMPTGSEVATLSECLKSEIAMSFKPMPAQEGDENVVSQ